MEQHNKTNLENDIYFALEILNHNLCDEDRPREYARIKRYSDDPLYSCIKNMKGKKKVLSVTESGDPVLCSIASGAESIDTFDTDNFSKYFLDLKRTGACKLGNVPFYNMFYSNNFEYNDSNKLYPMFRESLPFRSLIFWDALLEHNSWSQVYSSDLFTERKNVSKVTLEERIPFLGEDAFFDLNESVSNVKVNSFTGDLATVGDEVKGDSYDLVFTSDSVDHMLPEFYLDYVSKINVRPNGIILATSHLSKDSTKFRDLVLREDGFFEKKSDDSSRVFVKRF